MYFKKGKWGPIKYILEIIQNINRRRIINKHIEKIEHEGQLISLIIYAAYESEGINFFTPPEFSQQLAYMKHEKGKSILPHIHNQVNREVIFTQEVLYIKSGKVEVSFFTNDKNFICEKILTTGDVILLASGGHGFKFPEATEMIEVKQGPYLADKDKIRFEPVKLVGMIE